MTTFLEQLPDEPDRKKRLAMVRAWKLIPDSDDFRVAYSENSGLRRGYNYGEIAGAYGLALLVIDKRVTSTNRWGLVILLRRTQHFDCYWIYRDQDLSTVGVSRLSGNITVNGNLADGSPLNCSIAWSRKQKKWTCIEF